MNVEFRCPSCHSRMAMPPIGSEPGGISRRTCPNPACATSEKGNFYVQTEAFGGVADAFAFRNEDRKPDSRVNPGGVPYVNEDERRLAGLGESEQKVYLRERIKEETGALPDGRFGVDTLRNQLYEILNAKQPLPDPDMTGAPVTE